MKKTGVMAETMAERERKNATRKLVFFTHFTPVFLALQCLKSTLFYRGGRGTSCLYWGPFLALDSTKKDLNRWLKVVIMSC